MRHLLAKDLRILRRSPLLVGLLVAYPILIAVLVGMALSQGPDRPRVAIVNELEDGGAPLTIGGTRVEPSEYASKLFESVDPVKAGSRAEAQRMVRDGEVLAAIIVPRDLLERIQATIALAGARERPTVIVIYNAADPVKRQFVESTINSRVAELNKALSAKLTEIAAGYIDLLLKGGSFSLLGRSFDVIGLERSKRLIDMVLTDTPRGSPDRERLERVSRFAALAIDNLDLAGPVLQSAGSPIEVRRQALDGRRTPLDTYAVAVAVTLSLMLICVLLGAGMLALERDENAFGRLVRGLVSRGTLLAEKIALSAGCAAAAALLLCAGVSAFVPLAWSRLPWWVACLAVAGLAFAALGVAIGALAREVRAASLMAFLLALPIAFMALVPDGAVAGWLSDLLAAIGALFPFRPALTAIDGALNDADGMAGALAHLAALTAGWALLARLALRRFA